MSRSDTVGAEPDRFGDRLGAVRVGDAVLADDDLGVDARRIDVAEHFRHAADRAARRGRPPGQFHGHHLAGRRAAFLSRRDEDVHQHAAVERHDVAHAVRARLRPCRLVALVTADQRFVTALEDADDATFGTPVVLDPLDADDDAVAVHGFVEMRRRDVDVAARVERTLGRDEPVAGRMRLQPADVEVHLLGQAEALPADADQIAGRDERLEVALERGAIVARNFENLEQLAHAGGMVHPLPHEREDLVSSK